MNLSTGALKNLRLEVKCKQTVISEPAETILKYTEDVDPKHPQDIWVIAISANPAPLLHGNRGHPAGRAQALR